MATANQPALTTEQPLDASQYEKTGPGGLADTHRMKPGLPLNEAEETPSTSTADAQRHRRKRSRPVQYRPVETLTGIVAVDGPNHDWTEFPTGPSSTSCNGQTSTGQARPLTCEGVRGQGSEALTKARPVTTVGVANIHRTIARQLEQASAIADSEHQPCPFCSYIFSSAAFLVGHLKYRHGINLDMQIGMPTDSTKLPPETPRQPVGNGRRESTANSLPVLDLRSDESKCVDTETANCETHLCQSSSGDGVTAASQINQPSRAEVSWSGLEGQRTECSKELKRMDDLVRPELDPVAADSEPSRSIIICDMCTRAFTDGEDLEQHRRIHHVAKTYECQYCRKLFQNPSSLKKHTKLHTDGNVYACNYCDKSFAAAAYLKTHLRLHTKQKPFVCKHCGKAFAASGTLISHERIHINDKPYGCEVCGKRFRQGSHLNRHKIIHTNMKPHVCGRCNRAFADVANLRRHERIHNQDNPNICGECGKSFINQSSLRNHGRLHANVKPYICRHCSKPFASSGNLVSHERTHTNERPYVCKECGKAFTQSSHLKAHLGTHSADVLYVCKHCGRGFTQRSTLCVHERIHLNKKPYICKLCDRAFTQSGTLKAHLRTHTKEKGHVCKVCGKAFSARGNLRSHELIHTNEKPFKCGACPKAFKQGSTLRTHERTHSSRKPYVCLACGKPFADRANLRAHALRCQSKRGDLGILQPADQLTVTDAVMAQADNETYSAEGYPVYQFSDLRTGPNSSHPLPAGFKIIKNVEGQTTFTEQGNIAVDPFHHKSQANSTPTADGTAEGTRTNALDISQTKHSANCPVDKTSKPSTVTSDETSSAARLSPRQPSHGHLPLAPCHTSSTDSAMDLSRRQESLSKAIETKTLTFQGRTGIQARDVQLTLSHDQAEPARVSDHLPRHSEDEFTFDEDDDDDLESSPAASDRNHSDSDLLTTNTSLQESLAKYNSDLQEGCTMGAGVRRNRISVNEQLVISRQNHDVDLEPSRIIPLN